jgi:hypothetical protein
LIMLPSIWRDHRIRFAMLVMGFFSMGLLPEIWVSPHYFAPATGLIFLLLVQCARHLAQCHWNGRPMGVALVRTIPMIMFAMIVLRILAIPAHARIEPPPPVGNLDRARILSGLEQMRGQHLVIVRYGPNHHLGSEWVYNAANIDGAKVVWARDMGEKNNAELVRYFAGRKVWLIQPDQSPVGLTQYMTGVGK